MDEYDFEDDYISREDYNRELYADCDRGDIDYPEDDEDFVPFVPNNFDETAPIEVAPPFIEPNEPNHGVDFEDIPF